MEIKKTELFTSIEYEVIENGKVLYTCKSENDAQEWIENNSSLCVSESDKIIVPNLTTRRSAFYNFSGESDLILRNEFKKLIKCVWKECFEVNPSKQNNEVSRKEFVDLFRNEMFKIFFPISYFNVLCGEENNPPDIVNQGKMNISFEFKMNRFEPINLCFPDCLEEDD
jgi:hypothetical protein